MMSNWTNTTSQEDWRGRAETTATQQSQDLVDQTMVLPIFQAILALKVATNRGNFRPIPKCHHLRRHTDTTKTITTQDSVPRVTTHRKQAVPFLPSQTRTHLTTETTKVITVLKPRVNLRMTLLTRPTPHIRATRLNKLHQADNISTTLLVLRDINTTSTRIHTKLAPARTAKIGIRRLRLPHKTPRPRQSRGQVAVVTPKISLMEEDT